MVDKPITNSDVLVLVCGQVTLDRLRRKVLAGNKSVILTQRQFTVLEFLMLNQGKVLSVESIRAHAWAKEKVSLGAVRIALHRLRPRLGAAGRIIQSKYGDGYIAEATAARSGKK
jgi:DNA-binding response OmpR family regulator